MSGSAPPYRLSPLAEADLEEIWLYTYRNWSLEQADRYHNDIVAAFVDLAAGRTEGRPVDIRQGYRKQAVGAHVIFYRPSGTGIEVIRILHKRMDVNRHL